MQPDPIILFIQQLGLDRSRPLRCFRQFRVPVCSIPLTSTQFLNDRLLVNGNFGYRENAVPTIDEQAGNSGIIDFDIEYKLNPSGKFRLKAFNRSDNSYFRQNANGTTQGVGLIYREDFDTYSEWLKRYWKPVKGAFSKNKK